VGSLGFAGSVLLAALGGVLVGYASARMAADRSHATAAGAATTCPCLPGSAGLTDRAGAPGTEASGADPAQAASEQAAVALAPLGPGTVPTQPVSQQGTEPGLGSMDPSLDAGTLGGPEGIPVVGPLATVPTATPEPVRAFDPAAASAALTAAAGAAAGCRTDSSEGAASVTVAVTFAPSGRVTTATIMGGQFAGTPVGGCIAQALRTAHVPAFDGDPVTVKKTVRLQ
jgi:hypothetical protein